jgi:hypothetical protein
VDIVVRAVVLFFFIYVLTRIIGRRELSSLEPFDLILLIVVGDAIQQGLRQDDYLVTRAVLVIGTLALLQVLTSFVSFKFPRLRPVLEGEPVIIFEDGKPVDRNMRAVDRRRGRGSGPHPADRVAERDQVGRARDERPDQLHQEGRGRVVAVRPATSTSARSGTSLRT